MSTTTVRKTTPLDPSTPSPTPHDKLLATIALRKKRWHQVQELERRGLLPQQMAALIGVDLRCIYNILKRQKHWQTKHAQALQLLVNGASIKEVARQLKLELSRVTRWVERMRDAQRVA